MKPSFAQKPSGPSPILRARTRVKMCGFKEAAHIRAAVFAGADALGFVLYPQSPRFIELEQAVELIAQLPVFVTPVLLLVNPDGAWIQRIASVQKRFPHLLLQFHGDESPAQCAELARGHGYIKAVRIQPDVPLNLAQLLQDYQGAQAILLDAWSDGFGGSGKVVDWQALAEHEHWPAVQHKLILSGGLNANNIDAAIRLLRPFAVDVSSGIEAARGMKSPEKIDGFMRAVQAADEAQSAT